MDRQPGTKILLFGPQALSFDSESLATLRDALLDSKEFHWALDTLSELPSLWDTLIVKFPKLQHVAGKELLDSLQECFENGRSDQVPSQLPNILLTPLVVLTQLFQYSQYLRLSFTTSADDLHAIPDHRNVETMGFCTGILSAMAASSSSDRERFQIYGAVALRLAMLIGALVDAQDASDPLHGRSKSFATGWSSESMAEEMMKVIDRFPEAYISVMYDEKRATLTTAERTAPLLLQQLKQIGVHVSEVGLRGRFHSQCHHDDLPAIIEFCDSEPAFQFPTESSLEMPIHLSHDGTTHEDAELHQIALRMILVDQSQWYQTFAQVQSSRLGSQDSIVLAFGPDRGVPPSLMRKLGPRLLLATDLDQDVPRLIGSVLDPGAVIAQGTSRSEDDIAVISMSCQVAGAADLGEFWEMLCEGRSQHVEVPEERFGFETQWRELDHKRKWYGNFIKDHDVFDHKFFKKSPREIASTDPQQRLMLQAAYQAVEQSGYFNQSRVDTKVGCFLGACAADYEHNVACHAPNAFTATGNLKSFIAGKISHYFGWTGPGLTIDTACSASAVAIHQACRAILGGECNAALAGGVALMGNPLWFQNLAGASFLSPTGQCKPWDDGADGYCRGEAIACVFLKKLSTAIADGNQILGCIPSTAVYQNENCTPIVVPNTPSLSGLFKDVLSKASLKPEQVSVVEAHGTGTPVGDPAEYESVRQAIGGPQRSQALSLGSVKGLVGHTEGASGVVSLIKVILMIQEGLIPPQASFKTMSHHIKASETDMIEIVTKLRPWDTNFRAALINNYGASGSNASMVVTQPCHEGQGTNLPTIHLPGIKHPFWISASDDRSLREYCQKLLHLIKSRTISAKKMSLANLSFNICRQSNRALEKGLIFNCSTLEDFERQLSSFVDVDKNSSSVASRKVARPVILCFGGQISTFIGLDRAVYEGISIFRSHLDECNSVFMSIGLAGIYPEIFQREAIRDIVKLQTMLFAIQYACAKTWIDCGIEVAGMVGHSFGELTAHCIAGILSLRDTIRMIASRARAVRECWGEDSGAMMAIEADLETVHLILNDADRVDDGTQTATIACFNGPRSFTLAGSTKSIDTVADIIGKSSAYSSSTRVKKLSVTNAFHSTLVDPLMDDLEQIGRGLKFREADIPLERSTQDPFVDDYQSDFVADHMRRPVYFSHAVQRLGQLHPGAVWLEAGSNSTITTMASRALGLPFDAHFQSINITGDSCLSSLASSTVALWNQGLKTVNWWHHGSQTYDYAHIFLPPYQFEKSRHWVELKRPQRLIAASDTPEKAVAKEEAPIDLWTFIRYQDENQRSARFKINTMTEKYVNFVSGHLIAQTAPICPATLEVDMAIEALSSLRPEIAASGLQPTLRNMQNHAPICVDATRSVWLDYEALDLECRTWSWKIVSTGPQGTPTEHVDGQIVFRSVNDPEFQLEFGRYERLIGHDRCLRILNSDDADDIIQGRNIYKTFAEIVDYGEQYHGLKRLVGLGKECAGRVIKKYTGESWLDTYLSDCFSQVAGIWVNCMTNRAPTDMFIASGCEALIRSPKLRDDTPRPEVWDVFAYHHEVSDKAYLTDVFIFDTQTGALLEVMLGINYARVPKASMQKILTRLTPGIGKPALPVTASSRPATVDVGAPKPTANVTKTSEVSKKSRTPVQPDIKPAVRKVLAEVSGLEPAEIKDETDLVDIGIDSLMGMELAHDIETVFKCSLEMEKLMEVTDVRGLVACILSSLNSDQSGADVGIEHDDYDDNHSDGSSEGSSSSYPSSENVTTPSDGGSAEKVDIASYLAELLGVGSSDITDDMLLLDLGVDSLLSTELRSDLDSQFKVHIPMDVSLEGMTVAELNQNVNGLSPGKSESPKTEKPPVTKGLAPTNVQRLDPVEVDKGFLERDGNLALPSSMVLEAFGEAKLQTDNLMREYKIDNFAENICPKSTQLCIALTVEAFETLGCSLKTAKPGQVLQRIQYVPQHGKLVDYLYGMLDKEARLIDVDGSRIVRTSVSPPAKSSKAILQDLLRLFPDWSCAMKLTHFAGFRLTDVLTGKVDGIKVIFGSEEGRKLVEGLYCEHVFNKMSYQQMAEFIKILVQKLPTIEGPLKILEMGAGTGGTTLRLAPLLATLKVPVEYLFTDLSPSMVANARKKFKQYPFMKFAVQDIEKPVPTDLIGTQHIVVASNAVHATHDLVKSCTNIRQALRPDGLLLMLEMTEIVPFIDIIFGLLEGWWLFDDGRKHAIADQDRWERDLHQSGFGHVDWSDGHLPENRIQKVIIALASGPPQERLHKPDRLALGTGVDDLVTREQAVKNYVTKFSSGFLAPTSSPEPPASGLGGECILITGATGSLGTHLVKEFAQQPNVKAVIGLNRRSGANPLTRQMDAFASRGVSLEAHALAKLGVIETDMNKPNLGLSGAEYQTLVSKVTGILHNAWPMSGKRPIKGFEAQFQVFRNLVDLARDIACVRPRDFKVGFQLISSIGVVGHYPLTKGVTRVPEERMAVESVLANGYCDAKLTCERILEQTLHEHPERFRPMTARLGQVAGSKVSGYWNPMEHFSFLIKSSKTLKILPDFQGVLSWCPVNDMAAALSELLLSESATYPIYHIDNPIQQPWPETIKILADALRIPSGNIIPFDEWVSK
ncbi:polyketide synthase, partial [Aureobasidium melanogenum]